MKEIVRAKRPYKFQSSFSTYLNALFVLGVVSSRGTAVDETWVPRELAYRFGGILSTYSRDPTTCHRLIRAVEKNEAGIGARGMLVVVQVVRVRAVWLFPHPWPNLLLPQGLAHARCSPDLQFLLFLLNYTSPSAIVWVVFQTPLTSLWKVLQSGGLRVPC